MKSHHNFPLIIANLLFFGYLPFSLLTGQWLDIHYLTGCIFLLLGIKIVHSLWIQRFPQKNELWLWIVPLVFVLASLSDLLRFLNT